MRRNRLVQVFTAFSFGWLVIVLFTPMVTTFDQVDELICIKHTDHCVEALLLTSFKLNRHLTSLPIQARVRNGKAYLSGLVNAEIEKDLATEIAKTIAGVQSVHNTIVVSRTILLPIQQEQHIVDTVSV